MTARPKNTGTWCLDTTIDIHLLMVEFKISIVKVRQEKLDRG